MMKFPLQAPKLQMQLYKKPKDVEALKKSHVPFSGAPHKHPSDPERIWLVTDPYGGTTYYFEFKVKDIAFIEEMPNMVTLGGDTVTMARIWIRKTSIATHCSPFVVEDIHLAGKLGKQ